MFFQTRGMSAKCIQVHANWACASAANKKIRATFPSGKWSAVLLSRMFFFAYTKCYRARGRTVDAKFPSKACRKHRKHQEQTVGYTHEIHLQMMDVSWIFSYAMLVFFSGWMMSRSRLANAARPLDAVFLGRLTLKGGVND